MNVLSEQGVLHIRCEGSPTARQPDVLILPDHPMSKDRQSQWYNRMGEGGTRVSEPLSERLHACMHLLPCAVSLRTYPGMSSLKPVIVQYTRENDTCMNASSETWQLGDLSVQVSRLEKVYWPQTGFTKGELLGYTGR